MTYFDTMCCQLWFLLDWLLRLCCSLVDGSVILRSETSARFNVLSWPWWLVHIMIPTVCEYDGIPLVWRVWYQTSMCRETSTQCMVIEQIAIDICENINVAMITTIVTYTQSTDILEMAMEESIASMKFLNAFHIFWQSKNINSVSGVWKLCIPHINKDDFRLCSTHLNG